MGSTVGRFKAACSTSLFLAVTLAACGSDNNNPRNPSGAGPAPVSLGFAGDLGASGNYAILAKTAILQISGNLRQVAGQATLGTASHFEGTILSKTAITLNTHASMNGRALAQSQVALGDNVVTKP
jgi:hypothetical protein